MASIVAAHAPPGRRARRHLRVRKKVTGTAARPRLVVTRSTRHIHAQVVDDTRASRWPRASTLEADLRGPRATRRRRQAGRQAASPSGPRRPASTPWSSTAAATRYPGRIAALADAAREAGWSSDDSNRRDTRERLMPTEGSSRCQVSAAEAEPAASRSGRRDRRRRRRGAEKSALPRARRRDQPRRQGRQGWSSLQLHRAGRRRRRRRHGRRRLRQGQGGARGDRQGRRGGQEALLPGARGSARPSRTRSRVRTPPASCCSSRPAPVPASSPVVRCAPCSSAPASTTCSRSRSARPTRSTSSTRRWRHCSGWSVPRRSPPAAACRSRTSPRRHAAGPGRGRAPRRRRRAGAADGAS